MPLKYITHRSPRQDEILHSLIQKKGLTPGHYAVFFAVGDGKALPSDQPGEQFEAGTGYVLNTTGDVYFYRFDWNDTAHTVALTEWTLVEPQAHWRRSAEYRRARERVGLTTD
jgi:hypothetical protein